MATESVALICTNAMRGDDAAEEAKRAFCPYAIFTPKNYTYPSLAGIIG